MKLSMAQRLALIASGVALIMTVLVFKMAQEKTNNILTEHEVVDLADQAALWTFEIRDEFRYFTREFRDLVGRLPRPQPNQDAPAAYEAYLRDSEFGKALRTEFQRLLERVGYHTGGWTRSGLDAQAVVEISCLGGAVGRNNGPLRALRHQGADIQEVARPFEKTLAGWEALADLQQRRADNSSLRGPRLPRQIISGLHLARRRNDGPLFALQVLGYELPNSQGRPAGLVAVTLDVTRMIHNRTRYASRHLFFLTRDDGTFLIHPDPSWIGKNIEDDRIPGSAEPRWTFPALSSAGGSEQHRPERGKLLKPIELPELEYLYTSKPLEPGPALAANRRDEINQSLTRLADSDPLVRFTPLQDDSRIMALTCRTREQLQEAVQIIEDDWARPVRCRTFVARLVEMRLGIDESEKPLSLIVAASLEEVHMDVARANERIFWWALLLCAGAAGLALLSAMVMTRPLARLTEASRRLAEGDYSVDLPLRGGGEIEKLTRAFRHMTEQIRQRDAAVRDTLARMQAVLRTAADGIITFNERGIIEEYNQAAEKMFGYRAEEIRGRKVQQLIDVHDLPDHSGQPAVESSSVLWISKIVNTPNVVRRGCRKDGSTFWMEAAFSELSLGQRRLITAIFRDITRRVEDEEQIRQMTERLEARVRLRTTELEDAKGKLEVALKVAQAANRAKDEFIRFVSHELRTPLSSIMGFTQLLLNPRATRLLENPVPTLRKILESSEHLLALVNDLLDVARATAGKPIELNITEFDLDPFLNGVIEMTRPLLAKNANELVPAVPQGLGAMRSDETRVRQILLNLLSNACKFTEKGRIRLEVRPEDDWVVFTVADTGCGMTPEQLHNLFTPFYRVDSSTTRKTPGTGLGLSISKILCDQMGGSIEVSSVPGQGTTFIVRLPVQVREDGSARTGPSPGVLPAPAAQVAPLHKDTVLVIDDDPLTRELMESFLQREGFHVQAAPSGEDGVRLAREIRPGVITLDVLMPGFDGWAVLTALKSDPRTHDIPVVMLTIVDDRTRGYTLGASDYLTKPIDWDRLNAVLRRYCPEPASLLVVDDDELQRDHLSQSLAQAGWTVRLAGNGREALSLIDAEMPDLILLDLILPEMDGFQFLEELRGRPGGQTVPVIIVTAKDLTRNDLERLRGRVTQILRKGIVSREDLLARIRNYIHGASG